MSYLCQYYKTESVYSILVNFQAKELQSIYLI